MKKILLSLFCFLLFVNITKTNAQTYSFSHSTSAYSDLNSPTLVSTPYWDDFSVFAVVMPFQFNYYGALFDTIFTNGSFIGFVYDGMGNFGDYEIGTYEYSELKDHGAGVSTISYQVSGSAPNRIFKLETNNAGFVNDTSNADYANLQVWFYETSNILEIHIGPNSILDPASWEVPGATGPGIILAKTQSIFYALSGPAANPNATTTFVSLTLTGAPPDGMVYRFTPSASGINNIEDENGFVIFPNPNNGSFTLNSALLKGDSELKIYNEIGQEIFHSHLNSTVNNISIGESLPKGLYSVVITNEKESLTKKLIIQ